ncbi:zinc-ribbon domain containing protein [Lysobacter hankyongensis]|uniref:Probable zinc-binding domain-containing protein n=1 Tax=Lysobacter hankyongensis TaxID=1176535 RepID=A0ABP9AVR7_9GAMM
MSKSGKQRRAEIKHKRLERARRLQETLAKPSHGRHLPVGGIEPADRSLLARHNNTFGVLPEFYADVVFVCRDCGEEEVWTAKQQKWWHEVALGPIGSTAVRCLPCRRARRAAHDRPGANLVGERCARLRALGTREPDAEAWREVEAALADKWWGVRTVAIATLGAWGDAQAVGRLRRMIADHAEGRRWGSWDQEARRAAFKALGECLPASESDWGLAQYLDHGDTWALRRPLSRLPTTHWEPVLAAEWRRNETPRLERLCWLLAGVAADAAQRQRWRERFARHPDPGVRRMAGYAWETAR